MSIVLFPNPILRTPCKRVSKQDISSEVVQECIARLIYEMNNQKHGIGIAAPQIGINLRIAIVDLSSRDKSSRRYVLINPIVQRKEGIVMSREGCMSIPEYRADIQRHERVQVSWMNEKGNQVAGNFSGIEGVCMQHEIDHLNGKLFIDHVRNSKRDMIPRRR